MIEKEYIDLEETVTTLKRNSQKYFSSFHKGYVQAIEDLADIPAAKVSPVRHGHWIINSDGYYPQCSECMSEPRGREMTKYCGECGAKMDGDKYARKIH